jgi:drug/metabolite transporter (DMT)-like permease
MTSSGDGALREERMAPPRRSGVWFAVAAVSFFSTTPVLILWAAPLSPCAITIGRLGAAALAIGLLARLNRQPLFPRRADLPLFGAIGLITALHFLCYIAALSFTTIAHALAITYTAPIFVTLFSAIFLKEPIAPRKWLGVLVAVAGITILAGFDPRMNGRMLIGDLLALGAAVAFGLYSVAGRSQRDRYGLLTYAGSVYGLAALWMLPAVVLSFNPTDLPLRALLAVLAAGLLPLATGHTLYNAALRRTHATIVNLIATQEVTGGMILGALFLGQIPQANEIVGALVALVGIALVLI